MGLNTENLFIRSSSTDAVVSAVNEFFTLVPDAEEGLPAWPLELTFDPRKLVRGRKISVSDSRNGWIALVEATETVDPRLAIFLSQRLATLVAVAQAYEVTGSCGVALVDRGITRGEPTRHDLDDPVGAVVDALAKEGVPFAPVLFRETVGQSAGGWRTLRRSS